MAMKSAPNESGSSFPARLGLLTLAGIALTGVLLTYVASDLTKTSYNVNAAVEVGDIKEEKKVEVSSKPRVSHVALPTAVKTIYMSQCVVGTKDFRQDLVDLVDETELNSLIIDLKDYTGKLAFDTDNPKLAASVSDACGATDMRSFVEYLHSKNIYVIGRITVFQDPYYSSIHPELAVKRASDGGVWKDHKGLSFIDVGAKPYWDYVIEITKEAYNLGFDELNYDYIRFPSDGNMKDIHFAHSQGKTKPEALEDFFTYLSAKVKDPELYAEYEHTGLREGESAVPVISADLFGMTTTNTDDLNIGQVLERALPHFDFIAPMVYPSHYPKTWNGFSDPNKYPYEVVYTAMKAGADRAAATSTVVPFNGAVALSTSTPITYAKSAYSRNKLRTWIQDFDYGGNYDVAEVKAQIKATYDAGLNSWMIWAPSNRYTRGALLSE